MTLRSPSYSLLAVLWMACTGLVLAGCDNGGGSGNDPPTARISIESMSSRSVSFSGAGSEDTDGSIASYSWEFGDGDQGSGETASHTYAEPGTYTVTLAVTDDAEAVDTARSEVDLTATSFDVKIENVSQPAPILKSGAFTPANESTTIDDNTGPLKPGEAFAFTFTAGPNEVPGSGMVLSFASMFVQSNDVYYAFKPGGLPLFDSEGAPIGMSSPANVTDRVRLYDAGTEVDQTPGSGSNQAPRQDTLDQGPAENGNVVAITDDDGNGTLEDENAASGNDTFEYPAIADGVTVTVSSQEDDASGGYTFTITLENVSDETGTTVNGAPLVVSPGSYAVHFDQSPTGDVTLPGHAPGAAASPGIERIAEDGRPAGALDSDPNMPPGNHVRTLMAATGVTVPLSPGAYAAHSDSFQVFSTGTSASEGVERIAEDGNPQTLVGSLSGNRFLTDGGAFARPDGASENGPIAPTPPEVTNQSYTVTVDAVPGDRLSIGTMYVQSNDVFYAFSPEGLPLWNSSGNPISGDVTGQLRLYDAGTEADEEPGVGLNQAIRQASADTGPSGEGSIARVVNTDDDSYLEDDGFNYVPLLDSDGNPALIKVTVTPQ